jgi:transcription-repair coupling factor (superfamily II helicase)
VATRKRFKKDALKSLAGQLMGHGAPVRVTGLRGAARAVMVAELVRAHGDAPVLILGPSAKSCDELSDDLRSVLGERSDAPRLHAFPRHDTLPYDRFSPQPFVVAQRMDVLYRWMALQEGNRRRALDGEEPAPVVVSDWTALAVRVPTRSALRARTVEIAVGETLDRDALVASLVGAGYSRMPLVEEPGEIAVRGGILDLFPPHRQNPLRVEFFGDEVDGIREFDASSQRSQAKLAHAALPPPRELLFEREDVIEHGDEIRALGTEQGISAGDVDVLIDSLLRGHVPPGAEALAPILQPGQESVLDYLPDDTLVILDDPDAGHDRLARYFEEATASQHAATGSGRVVAPVDALLRSAADIESGLRARGAIMLPHLDVVDLEDDTERIAVKTTAQDELRRALATTRTHEQALVPLADRIGVWILERWRVVLTVSALSAAERLKDLLGSYGIESSVATDPRPCWHWSLPGRVEIRVTPLSEGFEWAEPQLAVVTEEEIFGKREKRRTRTSWKEGSRVEGLAQLAPGDHLVHRDHGIGIYGGLLLVEAGGSENELLCIEYSGGDKLFLPIHALNLVQRYGAFEGAAPRVDRLGGETWRKSRGKVKKSLRHMAAELLSMHAARELASGFAFSPRDAYFEEFEGAFEFEETPDQSAAIEDVLDDMQNQRPMDRLVCGDVGYGKTEVAIRAAFRAAMDGKQVAVLVPTTILCQQHFETFLKRFAGYPINVEMLSRFRTPAESKKVLEGMADGSVDIVVGTHRLLSKHVRFRDLGLLVIDEEQRFGVAHKERMKKLRRTVDVVTLTATPIPRTLQMSFTGIRDLSVIDTPPVDRLAVRTQICRSSDSLVREAILREVRRGGQVFFLHNRVATIHSTADMLAEVVPEAKVLVAHGQMKERDLEDRMHAFLRGEADVLLCTTIIESGLDIPRANTILVDRADTLGLAQMYQLRGRVGRSNHRAYAYFLIPANLGNLPGDAQRRLEAIQDLTELGSGFRLANMDLEIRGAGDLLGSEQSGNLRAVGYETYMEMLEETVEELRGHVHEELIDPEIRLPIVARLPDDYVPEVSQRLVLYKRLSSARDENEVARIRDELLDRYGVMPSEGESLLEVIRLKILARRIGIVSVGLARGELILQVAESSQIEPRRLVQLLTQAASGLRVTPDHKIFAPAPGPEGGPPALFDAARALLKRLGAA